jgi:hypothetical protein
MRLAVDVVEFCGMLNLHPDMRKAPRERLRHLRHHQFGRRVSRSTSLAIRRALVVLATVICLPKGTLLAQDRSARVEIEFQDNGRCTVSSAGDGFRSRATYMPKGAAEQDELRCAMPPVPTGRTLDLVVSLPTGTPHPRTSVPSLEWVSVEGRWVGTAQLTKWPDAVVVVLRGGWLTTRNMVTAAAIIVMLLAMTTASYIRRSRGMTLRRG